MNTDQKNVLQQFSMWRNVDLTKSAKLKFTTFTLCQNFRLTKPFIFKIQKLSKRILIIKLEVEQQELRLSYEISRLVGVRVNCFENRQMRSYSLHFWPSVNIAENYHQLKPG